MGSRVRGMAQCLLLDRAAHISMVDACDLVVLLGELDLGC